MWRDTLATLILCNRRRQRDQRSSYFSHNVIRLIASMYAGPLGWESFIVLGGCRNWNKGPIVDRVLEWKASQCAWNTHFAKRIPGGGRYDFSTVTSADGRSVYLIGGKEHDRAVRSVMVLETDTGTWNFDVPSISIPRFGAAGVAYGDKIYVFGGDTQLRAAADPNRPRPGGRYLNTGEVFDGVSWKMTAPMRCARLGCSAVVLGDLIYVIGGYNGTFLRSVEVYDPERDVWLTHCEERSEEVDRDTKVEEEEEEANDNDNDNDDDLLTRWRRHRRRVVRRRSSASSTSSSGRSTTSSEYDRRLSWSSSDSSASSQISGNPAMRIPSMREGRYGCGAAVIRGRYILVFGGFRSDVLQTTELYDSETNTWSQLPPMTSKRSGMAVIVSKGKVVAIGGSNGKMNLCCAEEFCPVRCVWTPSKLRLPENRALFAVVPIP